MTRLAKPSWVRDTQDKIFPQGYKDLGDDTAGQLAFLRDKGCDEAQGYYFSKPLPADQFEAFTRGRRPNA